MNEKHVCMYVCMYSLCCSTANRRNTNRSKPYVKTTHLVLPKEKWPPVTKNAMTMRIVSTMCDIFDCKKKWFVFEHSQDYQEKQMAFMNDVHDADFDFLFNMVSENPYHIDCLFQLHELCKYIYCLFYLNSLFFLIIILLLI